MTKAITKFASFIDSSPMSKPVIFLRLTSELRAFLIALLAGATLITFTILARNVPSVFVNGDLKPIFYLLVNPVWAILFVLFVQSFVRLRRRARLCGPLTKPTLDQRAPVLYLRSFYEDQSESIWRADLKSSEEILVSAFKDLGPLVVVGNPTRDQNENMSHTGAVRMFFKDEEWQAKVRSLMKVSQLVVIDCGFSAGLGWEIGIAVSTINPEKLVLSFLSWDALSEDARESLYGQFSKDFEQRTHIKLPGALGNATFILFDAKRAKWRAHGVEITFGKRFFWGLCTLSLVSLWGDASPLAVKDSLTASLIERGLRVGSRQEILYLCSLVVLPIIIGFLVLLTTLIEIRLFKLSP